MKAQSLKFVKVGDTFFLRSEEDPAQEVPFSSRFYNVKYEDGSFQLTEDSNIPFEAGTAESIFKETSAFRLELSDEGTQVGREGRFNPRLGCFRYPDEEGNAIVRNGLSFIGTTEIEDIGIDLTRILHFFFSMEEGDEIGMGMSGHIPGVVLVFSKQVTRKRMMVKIYPFHEPLFDHWC